MKLIRIGFIQREAKKKQEALLSLIQQVPPFKLIITGSAAMV